MTAGLHLVQPATAAFQAAEQAAEGDGGWAFCKLGLGAAQALSSRPKDSLFQKPVGAPEQVTHVEGWLCPEVPSSSFQLCALSVVCALHRLAVCPDLRSLQICSPGILTAPRQCATIVFMHAVGVKSLLAWNEQLAKDALHIYHEVRG